MPQITGNKNKQMRSNQGGQSKEIRVKAFHTAKKKLSNENALLVLRSTLF